MSTCPFCLSEIVDVLDDDGWTVYQPCGHPAPIHSQFDSLADLLAGEAAGEAVRAEMQQRRDMDGAPTG